MSAALKTLLSEYGKSLDRMDGEKDHQAAIAGRAEKECGCAPRHFKKLALALHKDAVTAGRKDLKEQIDLFDTVMGGEG